jgi:hypothetical protein
MARASRSWWDWLTQLTPYPRHSPRSDRSWRKRPFLEVLEDRYLLSAYVVTSNAESGTGTLSDAINQVNAGNYNEIDFQIGAAGSAQTISLSGVLPAITANNVYVNGLSQGGTQLITLSGLVSSGEDVNGDGLQIKGTNCTVSGLVVEYFEQSGIHVEANNDTIGGTTAGAGNLLKEDGSGVSVVSGWSQVAEA